MRNHRSLLICFRLFDSFRTASGFTLKLVKCLAIAVAIRLGDLNIRAITAAIEQAIPQWKNFQIGSKGEYVEFSLAPCFGGLVGRNHE